jgi:hypothetical protein
MNAQSARQAFGADAGLIAASKPLYVRPANVFYAMDYGSPAQ